MIRYTRTKGERLEEVVIDGNGVTFHGGGEPYVLVRRELASESLLAMMRALAKNGWTRDGEESSATA